MPYVDRAHRRALHATLTGLTAQIAHTPRDQRAGILAYVFAMLTVHGFHPGNFDDYATVLGVLESTKAELYRRAIGPYEDDKIAMNGDLLWKLYHTPD